MAGRIVEGEMTCMAGGPVAEPCAIFAQAGPEDEADLRQLLRATPTAGALRLGFTREPDYFAGEGLAGGEDCTIIARRDGRCVCMGRCSTRTVYLNGLPKRIGYLGELRMAPGEKRALEILRHGYRFFHDTAVRDPAEFYFTSIAADNVRGRRVLENGTRLGLPEYRFLTELVTFAVPLPTRGLAASDTAVVSRAELSGFLNRHSGGGQLGLTWDDGRWDALARHGVQPKDFVVVHRYGEIVATGAVWDQRTFKQTVIHGCGTALSWARPWINLVSSCAGRPGLPVAGSVFPQAAILGLAWDDETALTRIWARLQERAVASGMQWLTFAMDAHDSRLARLRKQVGGREYRTRLYAVRWPDVPGKAWELDGRPFQPEVGLL